MLVKSKLFAVAKLQLIIDNGKLRIRTKDFSEVLAKASLETNWFVSTINSSSTQPAPPIINYPLSIAVEDRLRGVCYAY